MKLITKEDLYGKSPCDPYQTDEMQARMEEWFGTGKTVLNILTDPAFPIAEGQKRSEDVIWATTHFLSDKANRLFAVACCKEIWHLIPEGDCQNAVLVAEQFALGNATEKELSAACDAARAAAWTVASVAADAAWDAACDAARLLRGLLRWLLRGLLRGCCVGCCEGCCEGCCV